MDRPGVRQVSKCVGKQGKMEKTGCEIICGAPTTVVVKGYIMIMMMTMMRDDNKGRPGLRRTSLDRCMLSQLVVV